MFRCVVLVLSVPDTITPRRRQKGERLVCCAAHRSEPRSAVFQSSERWHYCSLGHVDVNEIKCLLCLCRADHVQQEAISDSEREAKAPPSGIASPAASPRLQVRSVLASAEMEAIAV